MRQATSWFARGLHDLEKNLIALDHSNLAPRPLFYRLQADFQVLDLGVQGDVALLEATIDVLLRLDTKITEAFNKVLRLSAKEGIYMRDAAYMVAIGAVVEAMELRGWL